MRLTASRKQCAKRDVDQGMREARYDEKLGEMEVAEGRV